jgi:hypothetical protein
LQNQILFVLKCYVQIIFPDVDLLNCALKKRISYTWESLWASIQAFEKGHIRRAGDGSNINIWDDP